MVHYGHVPPPGPISLISMLFLAKILPNKKFLSPFGQICQKAHENEENRAENGGRPRSVRDCKFQPTLRNLVFKKNQLTLNYYSIISFKLCFVL